MAGDDPARVHQEFAATLDTCYARIRTIQEQARRNGRFERPRWPAIVLRTPKGWTGPKEVDGHLAEGTFRSHQVPMTDTRTNPAHRDQLEQWMRSYQPESLFDESGRLIDELAGLAPTGDRRMSANPHANRGRLLADLDLPNFRDYAIEIDPKQPAVIRRESTRQLGKMLRDVYARNAGPRPLPALAELPRPAEPERDPRP